MFLHIFSGFIPIAILEGLEDFFVSLDGGLEVHAGHGQKPVIGKLGILADEVNDLLITGF